MVLNMDGVVLVAGEGTRLRPLTFTVPKPLIPIMGRPLILYGLRGLISGGVDNIVFVIGHLGGYFIDYFGDGSSIGVRISYVTQERRLGIAHAIYKAIESGAVRSNFVAYLGDNYFSDDIGSIIRSFVESNHDIYIVLTRSKDPSKFGYALLRDGKVYKLIEKPKEPLPGGYTVPGLYMFRDPDLVMRAFKDLKPSWRGEYEITDMIQWFIDRGYSVGYSIVTGWWKDAGSPGDLLELLYLMLDKVDERIEGEVRGEVIGRAVVEKGAVIEGRIVGPAYIGRGAYISKNAIIEHYVDIESGSRILGGSLTRSLVLEEVEIDASRARIVDSIVGRSSRVMLGNGSYSIITGDYSRIIQGV